MVCYVSEHVSDSACLLFVFRHGDDLIVTPFAQVNISLSVSTDLYGARSLMKTVDPLINAGVTSMDLNCK